MTEHLGGVEKDTEAPGGQANNPGDQGTRRGIVKSVGSKDFGFITGTDGVDYFMHLNDAPELRRMRAGQWVSFELDDSPNIRGPRARNVRLS